MVPAIGRGRTPQIMLGTKINVILRASDSRWLHNNYHQLLLIEGIFLHQISFPSRLFLIRWCYLQSFPQHNRQFCSEKTTATCKNAKAISRLDRKNTKRVQNNYPECSSKLPRLVWAKIFKLNRKYGTCLLREIQSDREATFRVQ